MDFKIENGPVFTTLRITMSGGEQFRAEAGAMLSMTPTIELEAKTSGKGLFGAVKAAVGGESFFASLFTARSEGELVLAPSTLGDIIHLKMSGFTLNAQGGAYLAGSPSLELSTKGSLKSLISGEGLFLQTISGSGDLFLNSYGAIYQKTLNPGERYIVDTGHIVAWEHSVSYQIRKAARGLFSTLASGEGLVCEYTGPGKIWMQTRNLPAFVNMIGRLLPKGK